MPLAKVTTSVSIPEDKKKELLSALSKIVAENLGKPEQYMMVAVEEGAMMMGGKGDPAAFVDLRSIGGLGPEVNGKITQKLCDLLKESLGIPPERTYIAFTDVAAGDWGWNGSTFG